MYATRHRYRALKRVTKGVASHRRIEILEHLASEPGIHLVALAERLHINFKTAAEHIRRLALADLVVKKVVGNTVQHFPTPRALAILKFLRTLE